MATSTRKAAYGRLSVFDGQDSGRTFPLAAANALVIREIDASPRVAGDTADYIVVA